MLCPKCQADVSADAIDCPSCGVVLAKAAEAADRAYLRRRMQAGKPEPTPPPARSFNWTTVGIIGVALLILFGAWHWYTDDTVSDLDKLAVEVRTPNENPSLDGGNFFRLMRRHLFKFAIALVVFVAGYRGWKAGLSP